MPTSLHKSVTKNWMTKIFATYLFVTIDLCQVLSIFRFSFFEKISCHFHIKCKFFIQNVNKHDRWIFWFWSLWQKNEKWNEPNISLTWIHVHWHLICILCWPFLQAFETELFGLLPVKHSIYHGQTVNTWVGTRSET